MTRTNVFNNGVIHVQQHMCDTCIFRPGNKMGLEEGRVEQMVADATADDGCIPCHKTILGAHEQEAVCRGFYDRHPTTPLRLGAAMGIIKEVDLK